MQEGGGIFIGGLGSHLCPGGLLVLPHNNYRYQHQLQKGLGYPVHYYANVTGIDCSRKTNECQSSEGISGPHGSDLCGDPIPQPIIESSHCFAGRLVLAGGNVWVLFVLVIAHALNVEHPPTFRPTGVLFVLRDYYFTVTVLVATSLPPTNTVTLCEPFGAATT